MKWMLYLRIMKKITTLLMTLMTVGLFGQVSIITDNNMLGVNSIGVQVTNKKNVGVYMTIGSNGITQWLGMNHYYNFEINSTFSSTVKWYTEDGSYYPTVQPHYMFTTPEWGNQLLETGYCVNTVESIDRWTTEKHSLINAGVVIPIKKLSVRIGGGIHREVITGTEKYWHWTHKFTVKKYYDQWGVVNQPSGIFVVETTTYDREVRDERQININRYVPNLNLSVTVLRDYYNSDMTVGYDTKGGFNMGLVYHIKK